MEINIGNDIKLTLSLNGDESDQLNIISAKAYIINRTLQEEALEEKEKINRFMTRFPSKDGAFYLKLNGVEPDDHNIHMLGEVPYNCYPVPHMDNKKLGFGVYPDWDKKYMPVLKDPNLVSYKAEVKFTDQRGVIEVFYPASAQFFTGDYDVLVVAKIYQSGYNPNNTKTITVLFSNEFTLIPNGDAFTPPYWAID